MSTVNIPRGVFHAIQRNQWVRNAKYPDANLYAGLAQDSNHAIRWMPKQLFTYAECINQTGGAGSAVPQANGTRTRWRGYGHTSPFARYLRATAVLALCPSGGGTHAQCRGKLTVATTTPTTVGTAEFWYGDAEGSPLDVPFNFGVVSTIVLESGSTSFLDLFANGYSDLDLTFLWEDINSRLIAATLYEEALPSTTENGYAPDMFTVNQPILDSHRSVLTQNSRNQWKRGAAHLLTWTVDQDSGARTRVPNTGLNVLDNSSTTVSASTPGWTIDLTNRSTLRRVTVPCVFAAYLKMAGGGTGSVVLKDSGGTAVATCSTTSATAAWVTTTVNLPATNAKYDVQVVGDGANTCTAYAASLYQHA